MSDMTDANANDLIRNLTRQGLDDETLEEIDRARIAAEAAKTKLEEAEEAEAREKEAREAAQAEAANNTKPVPTHPRFDPELVKRCEGHKRVADSWISLCTMTGEIIGKELDDVAYSPKFIHIYYRLGKRLIDDILEGNYVAAGYVVENFKIFVKMQDVALITMCLEIWVKALMGVGAIEQAEGYADAMVIWVKDYEGPITNACAGGEHRGPYPLFTAFAHSGPEGGEVIDDNEVRTRYERLMEYATNVLEEKIQLHFID